MGRGAAAATSRMTTAGTWRRYSPTATMAPQAAAISAALLIVSVSLGRWRALQLKVALPCQPGTP